MWICISCGSFYFSPIFLFYTECCLFPLLYILFFVTKSALNTLGRAANFTMSTVSTTLTITMIPLITMHNTVVLTRWHIHVTGHTEG